MAIVRDDADRARLLDVLRRAAPEEGAQVYAWAIMPNHLHVVARSGPGGISRMMARVGTSHAQAMNRRHGRVGHLFQDRFRSIPVESDSHLRWLVRYVHRNPVEGGLLPSVDDLETYPWTGHRDLVGASAAPLATADAVLAWFAPDPDEAVRALRRWMSDAEPEPPSVEALADPRLLRREARRAVERAAGSLGVDPAAVWRGSRAGQACRARARAIRELRDRLGLPLSEIDRLLGLSRGTAARAVRRA